MAEDNRKGVMSGSFVSAVKTGTFLRRIAKLLLYGSSAAALLVIGSQSIDYNWQWERIPRYIFTYDEKGLKAGLLLQGLWVTVKISAISIVPAFAVSVIAAMMRLSDSLMSRAVSTIYIELIRNTPLLIQIFFVYFVLAPIFGIGAFASAVLSLTLFEGAYGAEIVRGGIASIDRGQWEASFSLGMGRMTAYRYIILPQALRRVLPPLTGQGVSLIKDSALVSTISIFDLTMRGQEIISETFLTFEVWFTVAAIYLLLTLSLSRFSDSLEKRIELR